MAILSNVNDIKSKISSIIGNNEEDDKNKIKSQINNIINSKTPGNSLAPQGSLDEGIKKLAAGAATGVAVKKMREEADKMKSKVMASPSLTAQKPLSSYTSQVPIGNQPITELDPNLVIKPVERSEVDMAAEGEAAKRNKEIEKGGHNAVFATIKTILNNVQGGAMNAVAGLVNVGTTATALGIRGVESLAGLAGQKEAMNALNDMYNNVVAFGKDVKDRGAYESKVTSRIENPYIKTAGQVTNTVAEVATNAAIGYAAPGGAVSGTTIQGLSVGGRSAQEVLDENKDNIGGATITGFGKGYVSYFTEKMFDANILTRGEKSSISKKIEEMIYDKVKSSFGKEFLNQTVGVIGENIEELVEDNVDNVFDRLINNKETPGFLSKEWWDNTNETAKLTTISTIIMSLLGMGGGTFAAKEDDIVARKAQRIIDEGGYAIQYDANQVLNALNMKPFYTTTFNPNGEVESVNAVVGKSIDNVNKKVKINPVITYNENVGGYNVIDGNTGVLFDTTPYPSLIMAEAEFDKKMLNLDSNTIETINNTLRKANMAIENKTQELIVETESVMDSQEALSKKPEESEFYNKNSNYEVQDIDKTTSVFKNNKSYTFEEIADIEDETYDTNIFDLYSIDNKNGDRVGYLWITDNGNNLEVHKISDATDDTIDMITIEPNKDNKFSGSKINNAIRELVSNNENAAIEGQTDIEGNIVSNKPKKVAKEKGIQGLEGYSRAEVKNITKNYIQDKLSEEGIDLNINDLEVIGSRNRGDARADSDLDVVVEYSGDMREDDLFNILNESPLEIEGIKVDINPITAEKTGTLKEYLEKSKEYDKMKQKEGGKKDEGRKEDSHARQETDRVNKGENTTGEGKIEKGNESIEKELSDSLRNYEEERNRGLKEKVKAEIVSEKELSNNERIVLKGFKEATGLDLNIYKTNKGTSEGAFFNNNMLFLKHNSMANERATNFKPYHEYGHWLKENRRSQWNRLYNIINKTITEKQINDYKKVLNNKAEVENMSKPMQKEYVINEIISDYMGNWANNIENWLPYIESQTISQEYADFLADITLKNDEYGYNVFGTKEQQEQMYNEITNIMYDMIVGDDLPFSNRNDVDDDYFDSKRGIWYNKNGVDINAKEKLSEAIDEDTPRLHKGLHSKFYRDSFFIFDKLGHNNYKIIMQIKIKGNEEYINKIRKDLKNGTIRETQDVIRAIEKFNDRGGFNNINNANDEGGKASKPINEIHNKREKQSNNRKDNKTGNGNNNEIKNSKQSSFIMPKNVKDIKNMNKFLRDTMENETDKVWKQRLRDAYFSGSEMIFRESPLQRKRELVQQYLNYKNGIDYSNRTDVDSEGRELSKEQQERYKDVSPELRDSEGHLKRYYHGTNRGDRVGNIFDPNKATSGAMAFFTDSKDIAKSYSENKADTSLSRDYTTEWDLFKAKDMDLDSYWRTLTYDQKQKMIEKGSEIGFDDDYELRFEKNASRESFGTHYDWAVKNYGNNPIKALYDTFINGGYWMREDVGNFQKVLDYIGVEDISYLDPYKSEPKVYEVYLNIKNPFNTSNISKNILNQFEKAAKEVKYDPTEGYSADMWDKTNIAPADWLERLSDDIKEGTTHAWTSIPDWVTDVLKKNGYDGITDTGGKHGGVKHQVVVPFYSNQIKNIDNKNPTNNPDIRYSDRKDVDNEGRELTKEQQEFFKNSKARDENGNLLVMYHGTEANVGMPDEFKFTVFDEDRQGNHGSMFGNGFYFTSSKAHAQDYAYSKGDIYEAYLNIKNPYIPYQNGDATISFQDDFKNNFKEAKEINGKLTGEQVSDILKKNGYDGIIIGDTAIAFYSNQIKNIDNTNPTDSKDIRYLDRYDTDENNNYGFYSQLEKVIEEKMPNAANVQQIRGILNGAGIKQDEMNWIGLDDYLKAHSLEKISKQDILDYIKANQINIETVTKGYSQLKQMTDPIKEDIKYHIEAIKKIHDKYHMDYEASDDDIYYYKPNGITAGTIGDYMADTLKGLVNLDDTDLFEKQEDGSYLSSYSDGISHWVSAINEETLENDMQELADLYEGLHEAQMNLDMIEDEYGDYADELGVPKYENYKLEGGTNYQEKLYTVPKFYEAAGQNPRTGKVEQFAMNKPLEGLRPYESPHWSEGNVVAHVRTQDFQDTSGNKVLFIDEIQSDMHQEGRKKGYTSIEDTKKRLELLEKVNQLTDESSDLNLKLYQGMESYIEVSKERKAVEEANSNYQALKRRLADKFKEANNISETESYSFVEHLADAPYLDLDRFVKDVRQDLALRGFKLSSFTSEELKNLYMADTKLANARYRLNQKKSALLDEYRNSEEGKRLLERLDDIENEREGIRTKIATMNGMPEIFPFKKNWHEFVLRRMINDAVQNGYDEVAWTTGRQQRERYNLAKYIDYIEYQKLYNHPNDVDAGNVEDVEIQAYKEGQKVFDRQIPANELADYIGKDLATQILTSKEGKGEISNLDESINENGKSGMYLFYDQEIPSYLNKYLKKWNSKVETITLKDADGKKESKQPGFKITEEMKQAVKEIGQPLYADRIDLEDDSMENYTEEQKQLLEEQRKERLEVAKMIKQRSFYKNIYGSDIPKEMRKEMKKNKEMYNYSPISNQATLEKAQRTIDNTKNIRDVFLNNELKTAEDTAIGELLIRSAITKGNYADANSLTASLAEKLTNAGQIIQAASIFKRMTPEGMLLFAEQQINKINKELNQKFMIDKFLNKKEVKVQLTDEKVAFINEMMQEMQKWEEKKAEVKDAVNMEIIERQEDIILAKIMAKIGEDIPPTKLEKLAAWRNISLLLNPKTIMRNLVSNTFFGTLENLTDTLGVGLDMAVSLATGERSLLMPNLKTQAKGLKKGLNYAIEDTKNEISTSLGGNKYEITPGKVFKNNLLNKLQTASYFGVEGLDRPFMQAKYESALEMLMKLEGLKYGKDLATEDMKQEALEMAKYTTFKEKNAVSDFLSKTKRTLNQGRSIGAADVIGLTYTNIPGNLTKKAIDYSPAGLYNIFKAYNNFKNKKLGGESTRQAQRQLVQATSRVLIGTGIMTASMAAFLKGIITASGDDEDEKVKALTNQENYAINVSAFLRWLTGGDTTKKNGDLYVTYSNYEPLSSMIAAAADMMSSSKSGQDPATVVYKGLTTWINTIAELSTLSNFSSLFEYGDLGGTLTRSLAQFPSSFIPTFSKQIAQYIEPNSKSNYSDNYFVKNFLNPMLQRIPGLSSTLENYYDTFGEPKKNFNDSKGLARIYDVFLNTSFTSTTNMDSVKQELYDLYNSTGSTDHLPIQVNNYFKYKGEKITLTAKEKAEYQKQLGQRTAEAFKNLINTSEYQKLSDEAKVKKLSSLKNDIIEETKGDVVLEPRGLAYETKFSPSKSYLQENKQQLVLTKDMQLEYEKIAEEEYSRLKKQGLYTEEKMVSTAKANAKKYMMDKYKSQLVKAGE